MTTTVIMILPAGAGVLVCVRVIVRSATTKTRTVTTVRRAR